MAGMRLANPVGLAAGYDKNCDLLPGLAHLGFGYVSCGTVVALSQSGSPRPRVLRDRKRESLVNSLGFPSRASTTQWRGFGQGEDLTARR